MNRKYFYFISGFTFFSFLIILFFFIVIKPEQRAVAAIQQLNTPPFHTYITGTGIVEPASGRIIISPPFSRTVEKINFSVNDQVKKGEILFELYNQDLKSSLIIRQKKYQESLSNLNKLKALPQQVDLTIAFEKLEREQAIFNQSIIQYYQGIRCARSKIEKCILLYKYQQAESEYLVAQAQFDKVRFGVWEPELKIAWDTVEQAKADVEAMEVEIERTYIRSPIDGTVLQMNIRKGEISDPGKAAIILGNIDELHLKVSIDQFNVSKFQPGNPAVAFKQGDTTTEYPLEFLHIEPVMIPKKYLTNELQEKVDTLVLEILYKIKKNNSQIIIGEEMNVYILVDDEATEV